MCKIIEDLIMEERAEATVAATSAEKRKTVLRMLDARKYALEEMVGISGLPMDEVKKLQAGQDA